MTTPASPNIFTNRAVAKADAKERTFWERVIEKGDQRDGDLEHAMGLMTRHNTLEETRTEALAWAEKAKSALAELPESELRNLLMDLSDFVVSRVV